MTTVSIFTFRAFSLALKSIFFYFTHLYIFLVSFISVRCSLNSFHLSYRIEFLLYFLCVISVVKSLRQGFDSYSTYCNFGVHTFWVKPRLRILQENKSTHRRYLNIFFIKWKVWTSRGLVLKKNWFLKSVKELKYRYQISIRPRSSPLSKHFFQSRLQLQFYS